jgi:hypothetical protein
MSNEVHELSIDELDTASGGNVATATIVAPMEANERFVGLLLSR